MNALQEAAQRAVKKQDPNVVSFDIATVLIIIQVIQALIPILRDMCDKDAEAVPELASDALDCGLLLPRTREWRIARRAAIRELGSKDYKEAGGDEMLKGVLGVAADDDGTLVAQVYSEV